MRQFILVAFLLAAITSFAQQQDIVIHVQELHAADTAFNYHPDTMFIRFEGWYNGSLDTCILSFETNLNPKTDSMFLSREAFVRGRVKMPFAYYRSAFQNGGKDINETIANMILAPFHLKYIPPTETEEPVNTNQ